jgi:hypothetical protein
MFGIVEPYRAHDHVLLGESEDELKLWHNTISENTIVLK